MGASYIVFFFNDTATTEIYTLSLHDALPISTGGGGLAEGGGVGRHNHTTGQEGGKLPAGGLLGREAQAPTPLDAHRRLGRSRDRKSTRLNSSHANISYAVFCLKKTDSSSQFY